MIDVPIGDDDPEDAFSSLDPFDDRLAVLARAVDSIEAHQDEIRVHFRILNALAELARMVAEKPDRLDELLPLMVRLSVLP